MTDIHKLWKKPTAAYQTKCICQTGVQQDVVDEFYEHGRMPNDPCFKCFLSCLAINVQVVTPNTGDVNVERLAENFDHLDFQLVEKCSKFVEPDVCQKVYLVAKCINDEVSKRFS